MTVNRLIPEPEWFAHLDPLLRSTQILRNRYYIKSAQLVFHHTGSPAILAEALGVSRSLLTSSYCEYNGCIAPHLAENIEKTVGPEFITREMLLPRFDWSKGK